MKKILNFVILTLLCSLAYGQTGHSSKRSKIYFEHKEHIIDLNFRQNKSVLEDLVNFIELLQNDSLATISKIEFRSTTSPEGGISLNDKLSLDRTNAIVSYLSNNAALSNIAFEKKSIGIDWDALRELVLNCDMEYKDEVINIIDNTPEETWGRVNPSDRWLSLVDSRNKHLMDLRGGEPYRWMYTNLFPELRSGSVHIIYSKEELPPVIEEKIDTVVQEEYDTVPMIVEPVIEPIVTEKPLFAIKTNLLFDLATLINVEIEVPIGQRWSIAGEWIFPWWTSCGNSSNSWQSGSSSSRNTLEILNANLEGKYWFGDRTNLPVMTGWFAGIYGGWGKYDLECNAEGYQGEFHTFGLTGGYAHTINKSGSLRMEYSLGVGYMNTDYHHYMEHWGTDDTWHTIRQKSGNYTWVGPTRAKVSLVWMLNRKVK